MGSLGLSCCKIKCDTQNVKYFLNLKILVLVSYSLSYVIVHISRINILVLDITLKYFFYVELIVLEITAINLINSSALKHLYKFLQRYN